MCVRALQHSQHRLLVGTPTYLRSQIAPIASPSKLPGVQLVNNLSSALETHHLAIKRRTGFDACVFFRLATRRSRRRSWMLLFLSIKKIIIRKAPKQRPVLNLPAATGFSYKWAESASHYKPPGSRPDCPASITDETAAYKGFQEGWKWVCYCGN